MIKRLALIFLSFGAIILLVLSTLSIIGYSLLYPAIYFEAFEEAGAYEYIDAQVTQTPNMFLAMPDNKTKNLIEPLIEHTFSYIRSEEDTLNLSVRIDRDKLRGFFITSVNNLSVCNQGQDPFNETKPCLPAGKTADEFLDEFFIKKNISFLEGEYTDLAIVYGLQEGSEGKQALEKIRTGIYFYKIGLLIMGILLFCCLASIYFLRSSLKGYFFIMGIIFLVSSLFLLMGVFFGTEYALTALSDAPISEQIFINLIETFLRHLEKRIYFSGGGLFCISLLFLGISFLKEETVARVQRKA